MLTEKEKRLHRVCFTGHRPEKLTQPESVIIQGLEKAIDDYKYALKKHGVMTAIGGLTTVLSASSTVIEAFSGDFSVQMSAGLAISGGLITYTATQLNDYFEKNANQSL